MAIENQPPGWGVVRAELPAARPARAVRPNLSASMVDGAAYGAMVGVGETYLAAFALAMGVGEVMSGIVTTVPLVIGGLIQLVSPLAIRRLGSYKAWVVGCATLQALAFVPLIVGALVGRVHVATVLLAATMYWGAGMATGAAWNTWIGTLVPSRIRSRFFAHRTRTCQLAVFGGFLLGGLALQWAAEREFESAAFAGLFAAALLARLVSVWHLQRQSEHPGLAERMVCIPLREIRQVLRAGGGGRLLVYLITVQGMVQLSGPYFAPFLFRELQTSYGMYVLLLSLVYLSKVISLPLWGRVGKSIGAHRLLWLGGIGIIPASGLWICSQNLVWIAVLQVATGACWAAYELGFFLLFFESIDERVRTSILTYYNCLNTIAWVSGAVVGGILLSSLGAGLFGYFVLFGISSAGRAAALLLLARVPPVCVPTGYIELRALTVRLGAASNDAPILPSLPQPKSRAA